MGMESNNGLMARDTEAIGIKAKCMEMENLLWEIHFKEKMIRNLTMKKVI